MRLRTSLLMVAASASVFAAEPQPSADQPLEVVAVTPHVSMLSPGGNVTVLTTGDGMLVVDSGVAEAAPKLLDALHTLGPGPVRYLVNTHHHFDHVGGNAQIAPEVPILAHANAKAPDGSSRPGTEALGDERELHLGSETIRLLHLGPGHTSGDTVVVMETQKVIATGDLFFNGMPPYIDVAAGANTANWVTIIETLAARYPDFKVVPGHGSATDMTHYREFAAYLKALRARVAQAIAEGKTREQAETAITLDEFTLEENSFLTKGKNVGWVYDELTRKD